MIQTTMYGLAFYELPAAPQGFAAKAAVVESSVAQLSAPTPVGTIGVTVDGAQLTAGPPAPHAALATAIDVSDLVQEVTIREVVASPAMASPR